MINPTGFSPSASSSGNAMFQYADARLALANGVTGHETPEELMALQQADKALAIKQAQAKLNYECLDALQASQLKKIQKEREQHKRLFDMGFLYG